MRYTSKRLNCSNFRWYPSVFFWTWGPRSMCSLTTTLDNSIETGDDGKASPRPVISPPHPPPCKHLSKQVGKWCFVCLFPDSQFFSPNTATSCPPNHHCRSRKLLVALLFRHVRLWVLVKLHHSSERSRLAIGYVWRVLGEMSRLAFGMGC